MENIDEQLKLNILGILPSISEEIVESIICALKYVGLETMSDLQYVEEEDLILILRPIQRRKLVKAWSEQTVFVNEARHTLLPSKNPDKSKKQQEINENVTEKSEILLSENSDESKKHQNINVNTTVPFSEARSVLEPLKYSDTPCFKSSTLPSESYNVKEKKDTVLMQVYAKYKPKLKRSSADVQQEVWRKIAEEVCQRCSLKYDELQCKNRIKSLKSAYYSLKYNKKYMDSEKTAIFFNEARNAFDPSFDPKSPVTTVVESSNGASLRISNENFKERLVLLRLYVKYKTELFSSSGNEASIWMKISEEASKYIPQCDAKICCNQIQIMKCEYEKNKNNEPYQSRKKQVVFLDEAENAFEKSKPVFFVQSDLTQFGMSRLHKIKLLQVYGKYKEELLLQNFDVEKQIIWEKVAREVTTCSSYYGKRRCCYEINRMKKLYEKVKENGAKPYYFEEASQVFESTEYADKTVTIKVTNLSKGTSMSYSEKLSILIDLFKPFGPIARMYLAKEKATGLPQEKLSKETVRGSSQAAASSSSNTATPNHQLLEGGDVNQNHLAHLVEMGFSRSLVTEALLNTTSFDQAMDYLLSSSSHGQGSSCENAGDFAFVKFERHEDAARAIQAVNGFQLDNQILNVEWAKPSSTNEILEID